MTVPSRLPLWAYELAQSRATGTAPRAGSSRLARGGAWVSAGVPFRPRRAFYQLPIGVGGGSSSGSVRSELWKGQQSLLTWGIAQIALAITSS